MPRPGGTEEAEHLAVPDLEGTVVERDAIDEPLGQVLDHQAGPPFGSSRVAASVIVSAPPAT